MGFEFSFINPEADEESSEQMKMLQEAQEEIDLEALQVWPGKPLVIPAVVSTCEGFILRKYSSYSS